MGDRASADSLRWNPDLVLVQRGADTADLPAAPAGCWWRLQGQGSRPAGDAQRPGVVSLVAELRHEPQGHRGIGPVEDRRRGAQVARRVGRRQSDRLRAMVNRPSIPRQCRGPDGRPQPRASRRLHRTTFQESSLLEYPRLKPKGRVGPAGHRNHRRERITRP
jgi:hypothetical protein